MKLTIWLLAGALCTCSPSARAQSSVLCARLNVLAADPSVAAAHWGIAVESLNGTLLCGIHQAQLFRPASNDKLFTATAALALLGADRHFETEATAEGDRTGSTLTGDLVLAGRGDPGLGTDDVPYRPPTAAPGPTPKPTGANAAIPGLDQLADAVYESGIRTITGDIVGDDRWFAWEPYPPNWSLDDTTYGFGAPVSALNLHDNAVTVTVSAPGGEGQTANVTIAPDVPLFVLNAAVAVSSASGDCSRSIDYRRDPGTRTLTVSGTIAPHAPPCHASLAVPDPAEFAAGAFREALVQRGIVVTGQALARHNAPARAVPASHADPATAQAEAILNQPYLPERPALACDMQTNDPQPALASAGTVLARHSSPTLAEDLTYTLKESDNLHAEVTLRNLGTIVSCQHTGRAGVAAVRAFLLHAGILPGDFALDDGSGLSDHDLVTPRALAQILVYAAGQPWFPAFKAMLPIGGVDGTLAGRFHGLLKGRVFAKTGTLGESRALSGYLTAASGTTLVFSLLVDNHLPNTAADRTAMDKMVEAIAALN